MFWFAPRFGCTYSAKMREWFDISQPRAVEWATIGENKKKLIGLTDKFLPPSQDAIYRLCSLPEEIIKESVTPQLGARIATLPHGVKKGDTSIDVSAVTQAEAAAMLNVGQASVQRARAVLEQGDHRREQTQTSRFNREVPAQ